MANTFNEDGTYNKTNWKTGDKITASKLNKIEESLEAINNNDISRHVEADTRLDALEEQAAAIKVGVPQQVNIADAGAIGDGITDNTQVFKEVIYNSPDNSTIIMLYFKN